MENENFKNNFLAFQAAHQNFMILFPTFFQTIFTDSIYIYETFFITPKNCIGTYPKIVHMGFINTHA